MRKISGRSVRFMPSAGAMAMKASAAQTGSISARLPPLEWVSTILAEAADQRQADQPAGAGMGRRAADVAQPDAGHAHHQQRQQQQRQAQAEEAEMMGAQPCARPR